MNEIRIESSCARVGLGYLLLRDSWEREEQQGRSRIKGNEESRQVIQICNKI